MDTAFSIAHFILEKTSFTYDTVHRTTPIHIVGYQNKVFIYI
jgi:hypothetical protein